LETVVFSDYVTKINRKGKAQERAFAVTDRAVYNMGKGKTVKRRIDLAKIDGITQSSISDEFVIHVSSEYDYRLTAAKKREMMDAIVEAQERLGVAPVVVASNAKPQLKDVAVTRVLATAMGGRRATMAPFAPGGVGGAGSPGAVGGAGSPSAGARAGAGAGATAASSDDATGPVGFEMSTEIGDLAPIAEGDESDDSD